MLSKRLCYVLLAIFCVCAIGLYAQPTPEETPTFAPFEGPKPAEQHQDRFYAEFARMMMMLGIIIIVLLGAMWFLKRLLNARVEQMNAASMIKVVERRVLSNKTTLYVLEAGSKRIIFAESHNGLASLGEMPGEFMPNQSSFDKILDEQNQG
jgi:flagellar biogenesis protein FliO